MKIKIFIINGVARSGKDTFIHKVETLLYEINPDIGINSYSLVDPIKSIIEEISFTDPIEAKDDATRKLISNLLRTFEDFDGAVTTRLVNNVVNDVISHKYPISVYFLHIREPRDIMVTEDKIISMLPNAEINRVLVTNSNITHTPDNIGDLSVRDIDYDIEINNDGDLSNLETWAETFINTHILNGNNT